MPIPRNSFLKQLNRRDAWNSVSRRWSGGGDSAHNFSGSGYSMDGLVAGMYGGDSGGYGTDSAEAKRKRVMVVVDETSESKHAMMWALTHVANEGDTMTLLHVLSPHQFSDSSSYFANSLGSLCKACKPQVEVEVLVIQGPALATVLSQVKKLEVSVLVLGQKKSSPFISCICGSSRSEEFVQKCIDGSDCLTIGVRKQSKGVNGYLINTRWQKNFWLLA